VRAGRALPRAQPGHAKSFATSMSTLQSQFSWLESVF
jgi:hypothetical protein